MVRCRSVCVIILYSKNQRFVLIDSFEINMFWHLKLGITTKFFLNVVIVVYMINTVKVKLQRMGNGKHLLFSK